MRRYLLISTIHILFRRDEVHQILDMQTLSLAHMQKLLWAIILLHEAVNMDARICRSEIR